MGWLASTVNQNAFFDIGHLDGIGAPDIVALGGCFMNNGNGTFVAEQNDDPLLGGVIQRLRSNSKCDVLDQPGPAGRVMDEVWERAGAKGFARRGDEEAGWNPTLL